MAENKENLQTNGIENKLDQQTDIIDIRKDETAKVPEEVETWLRKIEKVSPGDANIVRDDQTGQPILQPSAPSNPIITLPVSKGTFTSGFSKKISEAGKWMSEFIFRFIKIKIQNNKAIIKFKNDS